MDEPSPFVVTGVANYTTTEKVTKKRCAALALGAEYEYDA